MAGDQLSNSGVKLTDILDRLESEVEDEGQPTVGDLLSAIGERALGPLLFISGIFAVSPLGTIPGASVFIASIIILVAIQSFSSEHGLWLPRKLEQKTIDPDRLSSLVDKSRPYTRKIDNYLGKHLQVLVRKPAFFITIIAVLGLAMLTYPLALVPGGAALTAIPIMVYGIGLTARDGIIIAIAHVATFFFGFMGFSLIT